MSRPGCTMCTVPSSVTKPAAVAVIVASPTAPSIPWIQYEKETSPGFIGVCMNDGPPTFADVDRRIRAGLPLVSRTVTPPWPPAPSCPANEPYIRPEPTETGSENSVMPGADTVTCEDAAPVCTKPGALAATVVWPRFRGSNSIPPAATVPGDCEFPGVIVTVRL